MHEVKNKNLFLIEKELAERLEQARKAANSLDIELSKLKEEIEWPTYRFPSRARDVFNLANNLLHYATQYGVLSEIKRKINEP